MSWGPDFSHKLKGQVPDDGTSPGLMLLATEFKEVIVFTTVTCSCETCVMGFYLPFCSTGMDVRDWGAKNRWRQPPLRIQTPVGCFRKTGETIEVLEQMLKR